MWYRTYFSEYLSNQGGLIISVLSIAAFFVKGYSRFVKQTKLVRLLYKLSNREDRGRENATSAADPMLDGHNDLQAEFKTTIESQKQFTANYFSYLLQYVLRTICCCCLDSCCRKSNFCNHRITKYKKFETALEHLADEQDIINLILRNRITLFLHKMNFSRNQARAINYSQQFVIGDSDGEKDEQGKVDRGW